MAERIRAYSENRIAYIIRSLRDDAKEFLVQGGGQELLDGPNVDKMPLTKIWRRLKNNKEYRRRREQKAQAKGSISDTLQNTA